MKIFVLFLLSVSLSFRLVGQDGESDILIDLGESISENEENKINLEELEEELSEIALNKIDLNKATITDLLRIPNLSETEAKSILTHRKKFGFFFSLYELKYVPLLDLEKIKSILPYIYIPDSDERKIK